jgi:hypothetical protein
MVGGRNGIVQSAQRHLGVRLCEGHPNLWNGNASPGSDHIYNGVFKLGLKEKYVSRK